MTQIQTYENMSKEALIEHHLLTLQQHADDMDMLSKELASRAFMVQGSIPESIHRLADEVVLANVAGNEDYQFETTQRLLKAIKNAPIEQLSVDLEHRMEGLANETPEPLLVQVYKTYDISGSVDSDLSQPCTCPSGNGSLRWPCPVHPPETDNLTKSSNQKMVSKPPETPQQIVASLRDLSERMKTVGASMSYFGGFNGAMDHHGRELAGAGAIAWDWADGIEQDISVGTASPTTDTTTHPA